MPVRPVVALPHPVLTTPALEMGTRIGRREARDLADDLVDTMRVSPGCVGLAAPQIGVGLRAFAVDVTGHRKARSCHGTFVLFDPRLVAATEPKSAREGCMSVPDLTGDVERATLVTVAGFDPDGEPRTLDVDAFEARAVLHELDHLDGMVFLDRVAGPHGIFPRKVYR
jgi:peptide deformylase